METFSQILLFSGGTKTLYNVHVHSIQWHFEHHEPPRGGTVPPEIIATNLKPDITNWVKVNNKFHIFVLTVHLDVNTSPRPGPLRLISQQLYIDPRHPFLDQRCVSTSYQKALY